MAGGSRDEGRGPLEAVLADLYRRRTFGIKPGLEGIGRLLERLGRPQAACRYLHVAGTVGKGAVCAMLESMLRAAGCRTGLYTSPHLVRFHERFRVDGVPIGDDRLRELVGEVEVAARAESAASGYETTFFEFATAMAFLLFQREAPDWVVLETGLGGRLDATNVVMPVLSVITRIGLEHQAYLGDTLELITAEKCGIIKDRVPVICGAMEADSFAVVERMAAARGASVMRSDQVVTVTGRRETGGEQRFTLQTPVADYGRTVLPLAGAFQMENLATAVTAIEALRLAGVLVCDDAAVREGLAAVSWEGRLQRIGTAPDVYLDGAHCPPAAAALVAALKPLAGRRPVGWVLGFSGDKDMAVFTRTLRRLGRMAWCVPIPRETGADPAVVAGVACREGFEARTETLPGALAAAAAWAAAENGLVCITGSLYLVGEVLALRRGETKDRLTEA